MYFGFLAGSGRLEFPLYSVPAAGGVVRLSASDMQSVRVTLDNEELEVSTAGNNISALYDSASEGSHSIKVSGTIGENSFAVEYEARAYAGGYPAIIIAPNTYISLTGGGGGGASVVLIEDVTHAQLVAKRDAGTLSAGQRYRITDYVTTVANYDNARSAGHPFDLIVTAFDTRTLSEQAYAVRHAGDEYFADSHLEAWQVWYCLDNDTNRFAWADEENGKGVIYHLIDEYRNDLPFDFKNVQFKRWAVTDVKREGSSIDNADEFVYDQGSQDIRYSLFGENYSQGELYFEVDEDNAAFYYAFTWENEDDEIEDASIVAQKINGDEGFTYGVHDNKQLCSTLTYDERADGKLICALPNNVIVATHSYDGGLFYGIYNNTFGNSCYDNTFGNYCYDNTFGNSCYNNTFGNYCSSNTFGNYCYSNTFGNYCYDNTFGNYCYNNTFGNYCYDNTFGNSCYDNTFGNGAQDNATTKDYMRYVTLEDGVQYVNITCNDTTSSMTYGQNIRVRSGVVGTSGARKTCAIDNAGNNFVTEFGTVKEGVIS